MNNPITSNLEQLQKHINQNQKDLDTLSKQLNELSEYVCGEPVHKDKYKTFKWNGMYAVTHAEKTLLCARSLFNLINDNGYDKDTSEYLEETANALDIKVGYTEEGWVYASFPELLPKTGKYVNRDFFSPLYYALHRLNSNDFRFMEKTILCVTQYYSEDVPPKRVKDNDNIELKCLLDCAARTFLIDDNPYFCDMYVGSLTAPTSFTEICIIPARDFSKWIEKRRIAPAKTPKLYKKLPRKQCQE